MRKRDFIKKIPHTLTTSLVKVSSRIKSFSGRQLRYKTNFLRKLSNDDFNESNDFKKTQKKSLKVRLYQRSQRIYIWCRKHPRVVIVTTATVVTIAVIVMPKTRFFLVKGPKLILNSLKDRCTSNDIDVNQSLDKNLVSEKFFSVTTLKKFIVPTALFAFTIVITIACRSSSDLEDAGEAVSFMFEDSSIGEGVTFVTRSSISENKTSVVSITNILTTSVNYIGSAGASVAAFANSALLARIGMPVVDLNDTSGMATLLAPVDAQINWLLSSKPWKFISHQKPIMIILKLMGFQIPKFGPYPLSEIMMYHPSFNIYSDVSPEYSPWNWGIMLKIFRASDDDLDDVVSPILFSLLWDDYTLDDLGSLHPYAARFLKD